MSEDGIFWNGNDFAETLKTNCNSDRMPDKGKLNCVIVWGGEQMKDKDESVICYENHGQDSRISDAGEV